MSRPKSQRFGAVVATRYRDSTCSAACNRAGCGAYAEPRGWHRTRRLAREHAASHAATDARYVETPWGVPAFELAPTTRRRRRLHLGRLLIVALVLAVLAFGVTAITSHAAPAPPTTISSTKSPAAPPEGYVPTPAGPPATDGASAPHATHATPGGDR